MSQNFQKYFLGTLRSQKMIVVHNDSIKKAHTEHQRQIQ